jgi:hypothetical protein
MTKCNPPAQPIKVYKPFTFDMGLFGILFYDGTGLSYKPGPEIVDGTYDLAILEGGRVVELLDPQACSYTPPPCPPAPVPCGDGGGASVIPIDPSSSNLSQLNPANQLLTKLYTQNTETVIHEGAGTANNPFKSTARIPDTTTHLSTTTPDVIEITGEGGVSKPYQINHKTPDNIELATGLETDQYGHVKKYSGSASPGVMVITSALETLDIKSKDGAVVADLKGIFNTPFTVEIDEGQLGIDQWGRIVDLTGSSGVKDNFHYLGPISLAGFTFTFSLVRTGRLCGVMRGDFGRTATKAGFTQTAGISLTLDGNGLNAYFEADASLNVIALHFNSTSTINSGVHALNLAIASGPTMDGLVEMHLCL